jgi:hypothetical protein
MDHKLRSRAQIVNSIVSERTSIAGRLFCSSRLNSAVYGAVDSVTVNVG